MIKMIDKKTRNIILITLSVFLLTGGIIFYFDYNLNRARQDYNTKISDLNQELSSNIHSAQKSLETQIGNLGSNLSSQIGFVDDNLQNFKKQNEIEIGTLNKVIDKIEEQSSIRFNELKDDLRNIKIKSADFSAIVNDVLQSVVSVKTNLGQGSGAIIDSKGYVVTNVHVINGASTIKVVAYSGKTYDANEIVGYDGNADIAVLKINAPDLRALGFGDSDEVKVGEKVIAAGNPAGLSFTVTEGIVSAFRIGQNSLKFIQTDVPINPGNSGGPLINAKGEIIGINNFKVGGFEGLGFAISSNNARVVVSKIISDYESKQKQ